MGYFAVCSYYMQDDVSCICSKIKTACAVYICQRLPVNLLHWERGREEQTFINMCAN